MGSSLYSNKVSCSSEYQQWCRSLKQSFEVQIIAQKKDYNFIKSCNTFSCNLFSWSSQELSLYELHANKWIQEVQIHSSEIFTRQTSVYYFHCLERKSKSYKYSIDEVLPTDMVQGIFEIKYPKTKLTLSVLVSTQMIRCCFVLALIGSSGIYHVNTFCYL